MERIEGQTGRKQTRKKQTNKKLQITAAGICLFSIGVGTAFLGGGGRSFLTGGAAVQGAGAEASLLGKSLYERDMVMAPEDYADVAISCVSGYVNVRQEATTSSAVVGKLYNNCAATIVGTVNGEGGIWYQIRSGSVDGYVKAQYFLTGAQAEAVAKTVGVEYATIDTASLRLRSAPDLTSEILTTLKQGAEYVVLEEKDGFARLSVDADMEGYVSMDYIKTRVVFQQAVSLEEEAAKLAEETRRRQEAAEAIQKWQDIKLVEAKVDNTSSGQSGTPGGGSVQDGEHAPKGAGETSAAPSVHQISRPAGADGGSAAGADSGNAGSSQTIAASPVKADGKGQAQAPAAAQTASQVGPGGSAVGPGGASGAGGGSDAADGSSSAVTSATRAAIVAYAKQFLGNPYVYGGSSLTNGADCSGFVMRIYEHFGIDTGRSSRDQAVNGREIAIDAVQPGDLLFYASGSTINHVAIYIGGGQVIHAASAKSGIMISPSDYRTPCKAATFLD